MSEQPRVNGLVLGLGLDLEEPVKFGPTDVGVTHDASKGSPVEFTVERDGGASSVRVTERDVAPTLAKLLEPGSTQGVDELSSGDDGETPTHPVRRCAGGSSRCRLTSIGTICGEGSMSSIDSPSQ